MTEQNPLRIAVAGAGMMGRNHVRILAAMPGVQLTGVVDTQIDAAHPTISMLRLPVVSTDADLPATDALVVATPTETHLNVAVAAMDAGMHVLVEKPIASTTDQAGQLVAYAAERGLVLAVGHIERFNPAFGDLKSICREPRFLSFERLSPFTPRIADSVVMDLMVHDLDLALWIVGEYPCRVQAAGCVVFSESCDVATAVLSFPCGAIATLQASRATQDKVRRICISEPERFIVADSIRQDVLTKRETTVEFREDGGTQAYRQANVVEVPYLDRTGEPLARELRDFIAAIAESRPPMVTGEDGAAAVRLAREIEARITG